MTVHAEITSAILRIGPNYRTYGDPFCFAVQVTGDEGTATLKALTSPGCPIVAYRNQIRDVLRDLGFHTARWSETDRNGRASEIIVPIRSSQMYSLLYDKHE